MTKTMNNNETGVKLVSTDDNDTILELVGEGNKFEGVCFKFGNIRLLETPEENNNDDDMCTYSIEYDIVDVPEDIEMDKNTIELDEEFREIVRSIFQRLVDEFVRENGPDSEEK